MIDDGTGLRERLLDLADRIGQAGINGFGNELRDIALSAVAPPPALEGPIRRAVYSADLYGVLMDVQNGIDSPGLRGMANNAIRLIDSARAALAASPAAPAQPEMQAAPVANGMVRLSAIQAALESVVPPKMTESRAEYWKAGARATVDAINGAIRAERK